MSSNLLSASASLRLSQRASTSQCKMFSSSSICRSHYDTLGVRQDASKAQIKSSFYRLSKQHHPDLSKDPNSPERFTKLSEAYQVLSNDRDRRTYDRSLLHRGGSASVDNDMYSRYSAHAPPPKSPKATYAWKHSYTTRTAKGTYSGTASYTPFSGSKTKKPPPDYDYSFTGSHRQSAANRYHDVLTGTRRREEETRKEFDAVQRESTLLRAAQLLGAIILPVMLFTGFGMTGT
ncbi:hypothetical protein D9611_011548 [Ephemerocybe angulata]|uniref:J domain-containing protein n=2 Tax=Ephemerocybe angulata TaxID=980116 RepID=A0A8H6I440_9AGAR|nr:hypothetical protein D9611_011548 [Tulosesus angulatus]KAF6758366.1 hypothetical protein DFP72DRAFT_889083 [Tulosesus angulatus]KAF6758504.1 hypothetical protein DFP72DRAFT_887379 [Tulosesus angulatus]